MRISVFPSFQSLDRTHRAIASLGALTFEPRILEEFFVFTDCTCPRDAPDVQSYVGPDLLRHRLLGKDVRDGKATSRLQKTEDLFEDQMFLCGRDKVYDTVRDDAVGDSGFEDGNVCDA